MSQLKLWGQPKSINVQKALWALDELGLQYERIDAGGTFGKVKEAAYLALNPNGLVPTLQDGDFTLWESHAILRYLFGRYGKAPTHPEDPATRARADQWTEWFSTTFAPSTSVLVIQLVRTPQEKRDQAAIQTAQSRLFDAARLLDGELAKRPFVAGEHFTWGDIPLGAAVNRFFNLPLERPALPNLQAWHARLKQRAPFQRWIDIPLT